MNMSIEEIMVNFGSDIKTEQDIIRKCLGNISYINAVIDIKGLDIIETYLYLKLDELDKNNRE